MNVIVALIRNPELKVLVGKILTELLEWNSGAQTPEQTVEQIINILAHELLSPDEDASI